MHEHAIKEYRSYGALAAGLSAWTHGGPDFIPRAFRVAPFWYTSIVVRRTWTEQGQVSSATLHVFGPTDKAYVYSPRQRIELIAVAIDPELAPSALGLRCDDLLNHQEPMESFLVWPKLSQVLDSAKKGMPSEQIVHELSMATSWRLDQIPKKHGTLALALDHIRKFSGHLKLSDLSEDMSVSERQLRRIFTDTLGCSPKHYIRFIRFAEVLNRIDNTVKPNWVQLALDCGFSHQSHFNNEVRFFMKMTPNEVSMERRTGVSISCNTDSNDPLKMDEQLKISTKR